MRRRRHLRFFSLGGEVTHLTPLHRDPNPNLFVQLAGVKKVRLMDPDEGHELFRRVKARLATMTNGNSTVRGEEMMIGAERDLLEDEVWERCGSSKYGREAMVHHGDGLFIPQGWWHSVRGVGDGVTASVGTIPFCRSSLMCPQVNWWFRMR